MISQPLNSVEVQQKLFRRKSMVKNGLFQESTVNYKIFAKLWCPTEGTTGCSIQQRHPAAGPMQRQTTLTSSRGIWQRVWQQTSGRGVKTASLGGSALTCTSVLRRPETRIGGRKHYVLRRTVIRRMCTTAAGTRSLGGGTINFDQLK